MAEMTPLQLQVFNTLMESAHKIAQSPSLNEAQAATIATQMQADLMKQAQERRRMQMETQNSLLTTAQQAVTEKQKAADRAARSIAQYVGG